MQHLCMAYCFEHDVPPLYEQGEKLRTDMATRRCATVKKLGKGAKWYPSLL